MNPTEHEAAIVRIIDDIESRKGDFGWQRVMVLNPAPGEEHESYRAVFEHYRIGLTKTRRWPVESLVGSILDTKDDVLVLLGAGRFGMLIEMLWRLATTATRRN